MNDWPMWLKLLAGWGPLGLGWLWAELRRARESRDHHETRNTHDKTVLKINADHAAAVKAQAEGYAAALSQQATGHHQQMTVLTDKFVTLVERQSATTSKLLKKRKERSES